MLTINLNISDPDNVGIGKINIGGTNPETQAADIYLTVLSGATTIIAETLLESAVSPAVAVNNSSQAIPVDSSTDLLLTGVFTYTLTTKVVSTTTVINTYSETFGFNPYGSDKPTVPVSSISINLNEGSFIVTDNTVMPAGVNSTREWIVTGPSIPNIIGPTSNTGSAEFIKQFFQFSNVTYNIYLKRDWSNILASTNITVTETYEITSNYDYFVDADNELCLIQSCVKAELDRINSLVCKYGGFENIPAADKKRYNSLIHNLAQWQLASACDKFDDKATYYKEINALLGCANVNSSEITAFVLPDGSQNYETAWTVIQTSFATDWTNVSLTQLQLQWRFTKDNEIQLSGRLSSNDTAEPQGTILVLTTGFVTPLSRLSNIHKGVRLQALNASGDVMGTIHMDETGDLIFVFGTNYSIGSVYINGRIPLDVI